MSVNIDHAAKRVCLPAPSGSWSIPSDLTETVFSFLDPEEWPEVALVDRTSKTIIYSMCTQLAQTREFAPA